MLGEPLHSLGVWLKFVTLLLNYGNFSGAWGFIGVSYTVKLLLRLLVEVVDSQIMLDGVQPRETRTIPVIWWESR